MDKLDKLGKDSKVWCFFRNTFLIGKKTKSYICVHHIFVYRGKLIGWLKPCITLVTSVRGCRIRLQVLSYLRGSKDVDRVAIVEKKKNTKFIHPAETGSWLETIFYVASPDSDHVRSDRCQENQQTHTIRRYESTKYSWQIVFTQYPENIICIRAKTCRRKRETENRDLSSSSLIMSIRLLATIGLVSLLDCGRCQLREVCLDRSWSQSPAADRSRIVDASLGSAIAFTCNYCDETDGGEARLWYKSLRYALCFAWEAILRVLCKWGNCMTGF